jgi:hypothetical protein
MKTCFKCQLSKPLEDFYKHPQMADGRLGKCKECTKKDVAENIQRLSKDPEWVIQERKRQREKEELRRVTGRAKSYTKKKYPKKDANSALTNAIRDGRVIRKACEVCDNEDSEGHHEDYSKPLVVVWLCSRHHADRHIHLRDCKTRKVEPIGIRKFISQLKTF